MKQHESRDTHSGRVVPRIVLFTGVGVAAVAAAWLGLRAGGALIAVALVQIPAFVAVLWLYPAARASSRGR
jgi:hypothetical protein